MAEVLFVSKPVVPPWHDSSKNLVRDLARAMTQHDALIMGRRGEKSAVEGVQSLPVYRREGGFAPALMDQASVFGTLLTSRRGDLWHFFFAPNAKSSLAGGLASRLRGRGTLHTVCSAPHQDADLNRVLFADRTIVLSRATEQRLLAAGYPAERLRRIPPALVALTPKTADEKARLRQELNLPAEPLLVFPGDLEFGSGGALAMAALAASPDAHLVMACRAKTPAAAVAEQALRSQADADGLTERVTWVGETLRIHDYLACADVVALVSETLYAKMDYPLVLLEAMSLEVPVMVAANTPAEELGRGLPVAESGCVVVEAQAHSVSRALSDLLAAPGLRNEAGRAARRYVLGQHAPGAMAEAYEALYGELLR